MKLTQERLKELLSYNETTGVFTWKKSSRRNRNKEGEAGTVTKKGYRNITLDYVSYLAHRLAWFYVSGVWPERVDHHNEMKDDNSFRNLRLASGTQNNGNTSKTAGTKVGLRGVAQYGSTFCSYIRHKGIRYYLGTFPTPEEAHEAYKAKHLELHGEFSIYFKEVKREAEVA